MFWRSFVPGKYHIEISSPGIKTDIASMKQAVVIMGFSPGQIKILLNHDATLANIKNAIQTWLVRGAGPDDRVLFYFSGHGSQVKDQNGDETDGSDEVLLPYDTALRNKTLVNVLLDDDFGRLLAGIHAKETLVLLDACHSGTATKGLSLITDGMTPKYFYYDGMPRTKAGFAVEETRGQDNYIALSACREDEKAIATKGGSVFTQAVRSAMEQAASQGGELTLSRLKDLSTRFIAQKLRDPGKVHHPVITGNQSLANVNLIRVKDVLSDSLYDRLRKLAGQAAYNVEVSVNQNRFRVKDRLIITCKPRTSGYLNIINISPKDKKAVVLYPNRLHPENHVSAGTTIKIPGDNDNFVLRAQPPAGETLVVVFHTEKNINAHKDGLGGVEDMFKTLSEKSYRGFGVEAKENPSNFGAGMLKTSIHN